MKKTFLILATAMLVSGCGNAATQKSQTKSIPDSNEFKIEETSGKSKIGLRDFSEVAANTIDAVVHIKTEMEKATPLYESFFGFIIDRGVKQQVYTAFGSGVIISEDGYIITNNHVVQDAVKITVTLNDRREVPAKLIGHDPATDLAIIKIDLNKLQYIPFGNSDNVKVGEPVLAIGNPFNLTSTVTAGIISAKARNVNIINDPNGQESPIESFLQTDAAVNSGNSGGALVNSEAQLIGIITAIASGDGFYNGYSFAIPSTLAVKVASDLKKYGYVQRAYLGVNVYEDQRGVVIGKLIPNCAADKAGLHGEDVIKGINGIKIKSYSEMMEEIGRLNPGDKVNIEYERNGKLHSTEAKLLNSKGNTEVLTREKMEAEKQAKEEEQRKKQKPYKYYIF